MCMSESPTSSGHSKKSTNLTSALSPIWRSHPSRLSSLRGKPSIRNFFTALRSIACVGGGRVCVCGEGNGSVCACVWGGGGGEPYRSWLHFICMHETHIYTHLLKEVDSNLNWYNFAILDVAVDEVPIRRPTVPLTTKKVPSRQMHKAKLLQVQRVQQRLNTQYRASLPAPGCTPGLDTRLRY